ncbi:MAG: alpha/beta hydrolase [Acidobacteria bacterium]|nr:alpha/beta hydrolase [Acidobacteriota bacterium]
MLRSLALVLASVFLVLAQSSAQSPSSPWPPSADHKTIPLWPERAPGAPTTKAPEADTTTDKDRQVAGQRVIRIGNVSSPTLTLYQARAAQKPQSAVIVFPGGAYRILAIDLEGTEVCDWLISIEVNCVLVKYRVPDTGPYPKSDAALQDAQRAIGIVRQHAAEWQIDSKRVGVLGFSAGGHLAAALSTHYDQRLYQPVDSADQQSCRPDFALIIYPGYLTNADKNFEFSPDIPVTASTPPAFLVQAEDDPVHVENAISYFTALKKAGVPAELHIYAHGGHGYGLRPTSQPVTKWRDLATQWLRTVGVLPAPQ